MKGKKRKDLDRNIGEELLKPKHEVVTEWPWRAPGTLLTLQLCLGL